MIKWIGLSLKGMSLTRQNSTAPKIERQRPKLTIQDGLGDFDVTPKVRAELSRITSQAVTKTRTSELKHIPKEYKLHLQAIHHQRLALLVLCCRSTLVKCVPRMFLSIELLMMRRKMNLGTCRNQYFLKCVKKERTKD